MAILSYGNYEYDNSASDTAKTSQYNNRNSKCYKFYLFIYLFFLLKNLLKQ